MGDPAKLETVVAVAAKERLMRLLDRCDADGCCSTEIPRATEFAVAEIVPESPWKPASYENWVRHNK